MAASLYTMNLPSLKVLWTLNKHSHPHFFLISISLLD